MYKYKLISVDLDGTLLNSEKHVSAENRLAIQKFTEAGGYLVPNTGRSFFEMPAEIRELPGVRFFICSDGSDIYDKETDTHISLGMTPEEANTVYREIAEYDTFIMLHYSDNTYVDLDRTDDETMAHHGMDAFFRAQAHACPHVADFDTFCKTRDDTGMICIFFADLEKRKACREKLTGMGYCVVSTASHNLEVFSRKAGKGNAITALAEHLGMPKEALIAVGDGENDVTMFEAVGLALATANGRDFVKDAADAVICTNDEHIIPYIMEKYVNP